MATSFDEKLDKLSAEVDNVQITQKTSCISIPLIIGISSPFVLAALLWLAKPGFVTKKQNDKSVVDVKKLLQWTIIMSFVIWIALYLYTYCQNSGTSIMCWFKST